MQLYISQLQLEISELILYIIFANLCLTCDFISCSCDVIFCLHLLLSHKYILFVNFDYFDLNISQFFFLKYITVASLFFSFYYLTKY